MERNYQGNDDRDLMLELAHRRPNDYIHVIDLPYRLSSWALNDPDNTRMWFDDLGNLSAWAVMQSPFWTIDYAIDPAHDQTLHNEVLGWAVERASTFRNDTVYGRPAWFVPVHPSKTHYTADLDRWGFADQFDVPQYPFSEVFLARPADLLVSTPPLPPDYRLRCLNQPGDIEAYMELHRAVFETKNMTSEWRRQVTEHPSYLSDLNLVIEAPDSSLAAFCIGWFDPCAFDGLPCGQIEPLGVGSTHRGLGLAKILLGECFHRLQVLGARKIFVETDNFRDSAYKLYESVGFQLLHALHVYRKDFE